MTEQATATRSRSGGRHARRVDKITRIESRYSARPTR